MVTLPAFHTNFGDYRYEDRHTVFHNHPDCEFARAIRAEHRVLGRGFNRRLCQECERLSRVGVGAASGRDR
ncbi:MAG: hypothetical protein ACREOD_05640 [Candidatus Dormibacteria bacterium]